MAQLALNKHSAMLLGWSFLLDTTLRLKGGATVAVCVCACVLHESITLEYTYIYHAWPLPQLHLLLFDDVFDVRLMPSVGFPGLMWHTEQPHLCPHRLLRTGTSSDLLIIVIKQTYRLQNVLSANHSHKFILE